MVSGRVAIITDDPGWHGRQLASALKNHGLDSRFVCLSDCRLCIGDPDGDLLLPGFTDALPVGVFVRGVAGGTLEQVVFRLNILHALKQRGIVVYNEGRAIERTVDKPLTSMILARAGVPTPRTWICESAAQAGEIVRRETDHRRKLVQKPLFGSQGIGLHLVDGQSGLVRDENFAGVYYLQEFIDRPNNACFDIRVLVIDGRARVAMKRTAAHWLTNRARGADCEKLHLDQQMADLAEHATALLDMDYAGVDLIPDTDGRLHVLEINSIPAWYGLQKVSDINIAGCLIDSFVNRIAGNHPSLSLLPSG